MERDERGVSMLYSWTDFIDENSFYICKDESLMSY